MRRSVTAASRGIRRPSVFRALVSMFIVVIMCVGVASAGHTEPKPTAKELRKELAETTCFRCVRSAQRGEQLAAVVMTT